MPRPENRPLPELEHLDEIDSTSHHARRLIEDGRFGSHPRVFLAGTQTGGVGRFGRAWASPAGGVWMTMAWPVVANTEKVLDGLGLRVGLAMLRAIDHTLAAHGHDSDVRIKWPNDIFIHRKKVAGALCETIPYGATTYILVGVGINGNFPVGDLPEELRTTATTMLDEVGSKVNLDRLINDLTKGLAQALTSHGINPAKLGVIERRLYGVGEPTTVTFPDQTTLTGSLVGLTGDGRLRMHVDDDGSQREMTLPSGIELASGDS